MSRWAKKITNNVKLNEDWFSVLIAFVLILLSAVGILGKTGINITF